MNKITFLVFFVFISFQVFAQRDLKPGYIITNSGDTVFGQIDYQGDVYNAGTCYFKKSEEAEPIKYIPGEIKAYRFTDGKYYVSRKVIIANAEREAFLEFLVNGKADIFYLPSGNYFIEKQENGLKLLENTEKKIVRNEKEYYKEGKEYIGMMNYYMNDCPALYEKIQRSELDQKNLIKIATEYHNEVCPGEECIIYSKEPPKSILRIGYAVGCNLNGITIYEEQTEDTWTKWAPGFMTGLELEYGDKGVHERFSTSLGFYYSQVKHSILLHEYDFNSTKLEFLTKNLIIDACIKYTYPKYKLKPFIGLGVLYFKTLHSSINQSSSFIYNPWKKSIGPLISSGLIADLSERFSLKFEAKYHNGLFNDWSDPAFGTYTDNLNFLLSVQYKLTR